MADSTLALWLRLKPRHTDAILLVRSGRYFEVFASDVQACVEVLNLTPTHAPGRAGLPAGGFPDHRLEGFTKKLVDKGYDVAVCEVLNERLYTSRYRAEAFSLTVAETVAP